MHRCLELAKMGHRHTGINPMVGAVLVGGGNIIAEAFHEQFGGPHAEVLLIKKFDQKVREEDVLYVNLEPCCHTEKKTPPCTEAIIASGIRTVVFGMLDPNPLVSGKGVARLRTAGITVFGPVERAQCEWLNRGFVSLMTRGRPWITLKRACTLSGAIARPDGSMLKITDSEQDAWSHRHLRAMHDAILVGVGTVVTDDPMLTQRMKNEKLGPPAGRAGLKNYQPLRIILDPDLRIPLAAKIVSGEMAKGTMVVMHDFKESRQSEDSEEKIRILQERGVRILGVPLDAKREFDLPVLLQILTTPTQDFHGITSVLVEGGQRTWDAFSAARLLDADITLIGAGKSDMA